MPALVDVAGAIEMKSKLLVAVLMSCALVPVFASAQALRLQCQGTSIVTHTNTTTTTITYTPPPGPPPPGGGKPKPPQPVKAQQTVSLPTTIASQDSVVVQINGTAGQIQAPGSWGSGLHSSKTGQGGWWPFTKLTVGAEDISGTLDMGFMNKPAVNIDRQTGAISVGLGGRDNFSGSCKPADPNQRAF